MSIKLLEGVEEFSISIRAGVATRLLITFAEPVIVGLGGDCIFVLHEKRYRRSTIQISVKVILKTQ